MRLEELETSDGQLWSHYRSERESVGVMCLDARIVSVDCHESFLYREGNLVGMPSPTIRMLFRNQLMSLGEFPGGYTLEVFEPGLELTFQNDVVTIATAFDEPLADIREYLETERE
jgi:hypothetical protein